MRYKAGNSDHDCLLLLYAVPGTAAALRQIPDDILEGAFQIAGLAVHAIAEVHLYFVLFQLLDGGRAEERAGRLIVRNTFLA